MKRFFLLAVLLSAQLSQAHPSIAGQSANDAGPTATHQLKQYMGKFGTLMAGIEILRMKEKTPDWPSINLTLKEMEQTLKEMQKVDKTQAYKQYTDLLATGLADLKKQAEQKNKNIYDSFDNLTQTCFQCHAVHRPADFIKSKGNNLSGAPQK